MDAEMLVENYKEVENNIAQACEKAGRARNSVELIAVSKTKPVSDIEVIYKTGQRLFGENKVQEMMSKQPELPSDIKWHLIGHLQSNKAKYIVGNTVLIHSVDSVKLAQTISKEAVKKGVCQDILIEVNVAGEQSKFGLTADDTLKLVEDIVPLENIRICGLMTIAPFVDDPEENRPVFRKLKQLSVDIANEKIDNVTMDVLSMGMTNDYTVAIEEGATLIRVGTAIFGERIYNIGRN